MTVSPIVPELDLPNPIGLYSHAVIAPAGTTLVAISGQLPVPVDGQSVPDAFEEQMLMVVGSLDRILGQLGGDMTNVVKFTTYLVDPDDIEGFYETRAKIWPQWWPDGRPPGNTLLVVQRLVRPEFRIEIEALAALPESALEKA